MASRRRAVHKLAVHMAVALVLRVVRHQALPPRMALRLHKAVVTVLPIRVATAVRRRVVHRAAAMAVLPVAATVALLKVATAALLRAATVALLKAATVALLKVAPKGTAVPLLVILKLVTGRRRVGTAACPAVAHRWCRPAVVAPSGRRATPLRCWSSV